VRSEAEEEFFEEANGGEGDADACSAASDEDDDDVAED
jgi:hypothetical protein